MGHGIRNNKKTVIIKKLLDMLEIIPTGKIMLTGRMLSKKFLFVFLLCVIPKY